MKLSDIADNAGSRKKRMRVGRGIGSGKGKQAGRGGKGQTARSGVRIKGFEGGQMPLHRRLPKRGFTNIFKKDYAVVNLSDLERFDNGATVDAAALRREGLVKGQNDGVKILGSGKLSKKLSEGYRTIVGKVGLKAYVASAGVNGALMLYPKEIKNYRDWTKVDVDLWRHYWFAMVNRGVLAQPYWWDEQWTISVQHTEADIDKHLSAFDDIAASLAKAQQERAERVPAEVAH